MQKIDAYRSKNGKIYFSKEECLIADEEYDKKDTKLKFLDKLCELTQDIVDDCKWHEITPELKGRTENFDTFCKNIYIKKNKTTKTGGVHTSIAFADNEDLAPTYITFVNTTYKEQQVGFCDNELRQFVDGFLWAQQDAWIKSLEGLADAEEAAIHEQEKILKLRLHKIDDAREKIRG